VNQRTSIVEDAITELAARGFGRGDLLAVAVGDDFIGFAGAPGSYVLHTGDPVTAVARVEAALRPRWVWWHRNVAEMLTSKGLRVATCWDIATVHRILFGGWTADPAHVWAVLHDLDAGVLPSMGQLGLLDDPGDDGGNNDEPVRADGYLRPEWVDECWKRNPAHAVRWAETMLTVQRLQSRVFASLGLSDAAARSESATELLCAELAVDGLPLDRLRAEEVIGAAIGARPSNDAEENAARRLRDDAVLQHARTRSGMELRNPAHVRAMLTAVGVAVTDTRAWRLESFRESNRFVDALLTWRKAERVATTYGYRWLDEHVAPDGRLRGAWTSCDGSAGRMTASAGLHNMPADFRDAIAAEDGFVFVHADLGQIEPRVLAAVARDPVLAAETSDDDLYAPVAARLGVERGVAKVAVLAAMYGQTSGTAGEALRGMETAYPVAMEFLREADRRGKAGDTVRTYGGRLIRTSRADRPLDRSTSAAGGRGRYARNALIQGAAAELFKTWAVMLRTRLAGTDARIVLCLHDELLVHAPGGSSSAVARALEATLAEAVARWMPGSPVRYVAKATVVSRWSDAKSP
jgi:DNA polymerase I